MKKSIPSTSVKELALDNMFSGLYSRHISVSGKRTYLFFNNVMKEFFSNDDVPSSLLWRQDRDDECDTIVLNTIEPYREEYPLRDGDGTIIRWLVFLKKKVPAGMLGYEGYIINTTVIDVTDRKNNELQLEESRLNLRIATHAGNMSTWNLDVAKKIFTITNGLDVKAKTISLEEHLMLRHYEDNSTYIHSNLLEVMAGTKETGDGLFMVRDDISGKILYRHSYFMGIRDSDGVVRHVIGSTQDVTEVYRQREALQRGNEELKLAFDAGQIAAWKYDCSTKIFSAIYGAALAGSGITYEELKEIIHPDDLSRLGTCLDTILSRQNNYAYGVFRFRGEGGKGNYRYYNSRMMGIVEEGKVIGVLGTQRDITYEHIHQDELEEFNIKVNTLNAATHSSMWDYDIEQHALLTYTENALTPRYQKTVEQYLQSVHPKDRSQVADYFAKADRRELGDISFQIDLKEPGSNKYKRFSMCVVAFRDNNGAIIKYIGTRTDISIVTSLNEKLIQQGRLKDVVVNNLLAGLVLFNDDCKITWSNESARDFFGKILHLNHLNPGEYCDQRVNGKCKRNDDCILKRALLTGSIQFFNDVSTNDKHTEVTAIPVTDHSGQSQGVLLKMRDITESKRMLLELQRSKEEAISASEFVNTLMRCLPNPVFVIDPEDDFRYVKANEMFCKSLNLELSDIIGKQNKDFLEEKFAKKYDAYDFMLASGSKGSVSYEASLRVDNQVVTWMVNKSIIYAGGKKLILAVSTDISEIKELNKKLIAAKEQAQQADQLKSAFLANMSHEIRTPLNAIVGFSQLLLDTDDPQEKIQYGKIIQNNNEVMLRLVSDVLDISKIESGTSEFKRDLVDVSSFFDELTASLKQMVTNPNVKFIVDNPYKTCYINLDKMRFGQVITNFVTNAIKYTKTGYIKVSYYIERHGVMIRVDDTGVGISAEKRDRVFVRFDKLDSMVQGTGLGLSIAKALTEMGGGKIWFESEEGKGSSFFSWKPFGDIRIIKADAKSSKNKITITEKSETDNDVSALHQIVPHRINRILVAEDNDSNYLLVKKMLINYEVERAENGVEVVEKVAKSRYDLVLMDVKMPIMDGLDATRQIRKFNSAIPIVAVTANAFAMDEEDALRAGCNEFLAKPIFREDLINVLNKV